MTNVETTRTLPDGVSETRSDDSAGQVLRRTDFAGRTTLYRYYPMGRVLTRTYPDTSVVSFTYTPTGQRATATDARGTTSYGYDSRNRLVKLTYPDGRVLAYGYDAHGNRTALTAKIGAQSLTTTTAYDAASRPTQVTDPLGRAFALNYDADGNRTQLQDPNMTSTTYTYDSRNRLTHLFTMQSPTGAPPATVTSFAYTLDEAGRRTRLSEADGTVRSYGYDSIDRLTGETVTGSLSYAKTFAYDPVGNRLTQTTTGAGAASVSYAYDTRDKLTAENATTYAYDANGNVTSKTGEANYTWDLENRLTSAAMSSGMTVGHQYDADGNRVQTTLTPQATSTTPLSCQGNSAVFARGDLGTQGNWQGAYGSDGQYISGEPASPPAYANVSFSGATSFTSVNGTSDTRALMQPPPGTLRIASTYESSTSETLHVGVTDNSVHTVAFYMLDFDRLGLSQTVTAQTPSGTVLDAPRSFNGPTLWNGVWVVYTICGSVDFVFTNVSGPDAVVSGVFFGPRPPTPTATTNLLVDTAGCPSCGGRGALSQVVAETDGSGNLTNYYVRVGDELLEVVRSGSTPATWTTRFVHHDGLGSVRALTDETGTTTDTRGYEAFGTRNVEAGNDPLAYGFAGEPFQADSMLAYHRARWMDPRVGRFEGMDPLQGNTAAPRSMHAYLYADDDPADGADPTGLLDADFSINFFGTPKPSAAPHGQTYDSFDLAMFEGMREALGRSQAATGAQFSTGSPIANSPLHPEIEGQVNKSWSPSGTKYWYSLGAASFADSATTRPYNADTLVGIFHSHPNAGKIVLGGVTWIFYENYFSCSDARTHRQIVQEVNNLSSGANQLIADAIVYANGINSWFGWASSPTDPNAPYPLGSDGQPCP